MEPPWTYEVHGHMAEAEGTTNARKKNFLEGGLAERRCAGGCACGRALRAMQSIGGIRWLTAARRRVNIIVLTPVRLLGDGLTAGFERQSDIDVLAVVNDLKGLRESLARHRADLVLIDVTHGIDLYDTRAIAAQWPEVALVALGLTEQRQDVIRCGRAGFAGYVSREASLDALSKALRDVIQGKLACPAEISSGLLRALFRAEHPPDESAREEDLTRREGDVLRLIGEGLSNKEIARELVLSVPTVKHHVHNVLAKLHLPRRAQAMRRVRDAPWLVTRGSREEPVPIR